MPNYSNFDIIDFAVDEKPAEIMTAFDDLMGQKILDAIAQKKIEVAQQMFGSQDQEDDNEEIDAEELVDQEESEVDDSEEEYSDEDFEFDDEELENLETEEQEDENS